MAKPKPTVEPAWPPPDGAYDYVLTLNSVELAWEFLRRNKHYQRDYASRTTAEKVPKTLISGHQYWATADIESKADPWGMYSFREPEVESTRRTSLLATGDWRRAFDGDNDEGTETDRRRLRSRPPGRRHPHRRRI